MSNRKPKSLLSFIYNTTSVSAYRLEMHMDMNAAFDRFQVHDPLAQRACFAVEKAAYDIRKSVSDAEATVVTNAAGKTAADTELRVSTEALFPQLALELTSLVADGEPATPGADQDALRRELSARNSNAGTVPKAKDEFKTKAVSLGQKGVEVDPNSPHLLLEYVYYFFHFSSVREALRSDSRGLHATTEASRLDSAAILAALRRLDVEMDRPRANRLVTRIRPDVELLCDALAQEYQRRSYLDCW